MLSSHQTRYFQSLQETERDCFDNDGNLFLILVILNDNAQVVKERIEIDGINLANNYGQRNVSYAKG